VYSRGIDCEELAGNGWRCWSGDDKKGVTGKGKKVAILGNQIAENWDVAKHAGDIAKRISSCMTEVQTIGTGRQQSEDDQDP